VSMVGWRMGTDVPSLQGSEVGDSVARLMSRKKMLGATPELPSRHAALRPSGRGDF